MASSTAELDQECRWKRRPQDRRRRDRDVGQERLRPVAAGEEDALVGIVAVVVNGTPSLTSYRRVIVTTQNPAR
jgi:hypothetical protein